MEIGDCLEKEMDVKMSGADEHAMMQPRVDLPGFQNFLTTCRQPQDHIRGPETHSLGSHATRQPT